MKLYEYEAKNILEEYGVPVPKGEVAADIKQAQEFAAKLKPPFAVKAQALVAGRGKAGGILFADSVEEVGECTLELLSTIIRGTRVKNVLVEEKIPVTKEHYFSITVDRANRHYVAVASEIGGMDIEDIASASPELILRSVVNPREGLSFGEAKRFAAEMTAGKEHQSKLAKILQNICKAGMDYDAELIETNPLAETSDGRFFALDARLIIDDNALFRHPDYEKRLFAEQREYTPQEVEGAKKGLAYVKLDGDIGVVGNGAGLVMATLDLIQYYGGKAANFLDLGGGAPIERIAAALEIVMSDPDVDAVLINILGGLTHCDDVAHGITEARNTLNSSKPIVVRLVGTNEQEGKRLLNQAGIPVLDSMEQAAERVVEVAHGKR